jgi:uncharacterized repeat protein (TIGR04138 family)
MSDPRRIVRQLAREDGRYRPEAFAFLFECLEPAVRLAGRSAAQGTDRHISGQELLQGLRGEAQRLFGPLAAQVWRSWGVHTTLDWGHVVFLLVEAGLLSRREEDSLDDFREGFDFERVFVEEYPIRLPSEAGPGDGGA